MHVSAAWECQLCVSLSGVDLPILVRKDCPILGTVRDRLTSLLGVKAACGLLKYRQDLELQVRWTCAHSNTRVMWDEPVLTVIQL